MADAAVRGGMAIPAPERKSLWHAFVAAGSLAQAIVFARIAFRAWFLYHEVYYEKVSHWTAQTLIMSWTNSIKNPDVATWYKPILMSLIPEATGFRVFLTTWEIIFGVCLILGFGIRIVTILQMFANLKYILSKSYLSGGANLDGSPNNTAARLPSRASRIAAAASPSACRSSTRSHATVRRDAQGVPLAPSN